MSKALRILVLGVGNILYGDEGIGVHVAAYLQEQGGCGEHVRILDGGTLGLRLLDPIMNCDALIIIDAVLGDDPPGSMYRLQGEDLRRSRAFRDSLHQTDLVDTLICCELACGHRPPTLVIGFEPLSCEGPNIDLSPEATACVPLLANMVVDEICRIATEKAE